MLVFTGDRYPLGNLRLPYFTKWVQDRLGGDFRERIEAVPEPDEGQYPKSRVERSSPLLREIESLGMAYSLDGGDRLFRSRGHTLHDIYALRTGEILETRIVDLVVWPEGHEGVVKLIELARKEDLVLIPFGGGTSVSMALSPPEEERRTIVSVDMSQMNRILWVDESNVCNCDYHVVDVYPVYVKYIYIWSFM